LASVNSRISSFDQKPENGGTPAIANQPMMKVPAVIGISLRSPPILRMSCSSCMPWMTEPEPRNISALKNACVTMWKMAATKAPDPTARNM
jgi:hypothetical protein